MAYWRLFYHAVWTTKRRRPWLIGDRANIPEAAIRRKVSALAGIPHAVKVMPDHVHVAVSVPPALAPGEAVRQMKGASSFLLRRNIPDLKHEDFRWQESFGILSFGEQALPKVIAYIEQQERRHADHRLWQALEHVDDAVMPHGGG